MESAINRGAPEDPAHGHARPHLNGMLNPQDQPPRASQSKRSSIQARKRHRSMTDWRKGLAGPAAENKGCILTSPDGTLAFAVVPTSAGVLVERRYCPAAGSHTAHAMLFETTTAFDRWCKDEPSRFSQPLMHQELRRNGHEALGMLR